MPAGSHADVARAAAAARTIPNDFVDHAVTTTQSNIDLTPYSGKVIFLSAITADITYLRSKTSNTSHPTLTAGTGPVLKTTNPPEEFWVDPGGSMRLNLRAGGSCTLRIFFDDYT